MPNDERFDTTSRGGRYEVNGRTVDAFGKPVQGSGRQDAPQDAPQTDSGEPALEEHTLEELRDIAEQQDIDLQGATRKADVIARIREAGGE